MTNDSDLDFRGNSLPNGSAAAAERVVKAKMSPSDVVNPMARIAVDGKYQLPTSWAQQRLWFVDRLEGGSNAYHICISLRLRGTLRLNALNAAIASLVRRHETLRTGFSMHAGEIVQEIRVDAVVDLKTDDLRYVTPENRQDQIRIIARAELEAPFDLEAGSLIRARLIALGDLEHVLLITMHHIVSDGWSLGIVLRELSAFYRRHLEGRREELPPLPFQYGDYVHWEQRWLQGDRLERQLAYWRRRLEGVPPRLELP